MKLTVDNIIERITRKENEIAVLKAQLSEVIRQEQQQSVLPTANGNSRVVREALDLIDKN